ncbi:MAG: hypothetical protein EOP84_33015, partial [Verrucomicrobiaceae bacterium]
MNNSTIDLNRLKRLRRMANGDVISACPACQEIGKDTRADNLRIFTSGRFHCIAYQDDREHRRRIFALVGVKGEHQADPDRDREWRANRAKEREAYMRKAAMVQKAKECRSAIISLHLWPLDEVRAASPQDVIGSRLELNPRHFLDSLFPEDALLWTGEVFQSGRSHASRWRTCAEWRDTPSNEAVGPMVSPAIWKEGTVSRTALNVAASPFTVIDFDGFDGIPLTSQRAIDDHLAASFAIIRWLRDKMLWKLAAILHTGNKSLHAWFHTPHPEVLNSL